MTELLEYLKLPQTIPFIFPTKTVSFPLDSQSESISEPGRDPLLKDVALFVVSSPCVSTVQIQRHFAIGYNRTRRLLDLLEADGIVGPDKGGKARDILINQEDFLAMKKYNSIKRIR